MKGSCFFVTGTDTNVGKTYVTRLLTQALRTAGYQTVAIKPLASGGWSDSEILSAAADHLLTLQEITPFFYELPLSPMQAAALEGQSLSPQKIISFVEETKKNRASLLVEGVGGWKVPLTDDFTTADLAVTIGFPVILVVRNRLGALNHTLLTLDSIKSYGLTCAGIVLNHSPEDESDPAIPGYRKFFKNFARREELSLMEVFPNQQKIDLPFLIAD